MLCMLRLQSPKSTCFLPEAQSSQNAAAVTSRCFGKPGNHLRLPPGLALSRPVRL